MIPIESPYECPDCASASILPIAYGLTGEELLEEDKRGEVILGGCNPENPLWYCKDCLNRWPEEPPPIQIVTRGCCGLGALH